MTPEQPRYWKRNHGVIQHKRAKLQAWLIVIVVCLFLHYWALIPPILVWLWISRVWNKDGQGWRDDYPDKYIH